MTKEKTSTLEFQIFLPAIILIGIATALMLCFPQESNMVMEQIFSFLTHQMGWSYLLMAAVLMGVSIWLICSKYGAIKLGEPGEGKEYSDWTWITMLFTTSFGISVILLGFMDPISLLATPPLRAEPFSEDAVQYAHMYTLFVNGPMAWAIYGPATAAVAYTIHVKKEPVHRLSSACSAVLKGKSGRWLGWVIDILVLLGMTCGVATSLGMGTPTVTSFIEYLTGIEESPMMTVVVLLIWAAIFGTSVYLGLEKGIKRLSDVNLHLLFLLMAAVLISIPLKDFMYLQLGSVGTIFDHLGELMLGFSTESSNVFVQNWTVFYWAWWFAFTPITALFGAKISRGRTLRELILGQLVYGGCGCMLVYGLFGGYSLYLQQSGRLDIVTQVATLGRERALISILETLPFGKLPVILVLCLIFVFLATTIDSTAYTLASASLGYIAPTAQPPRWTRMLWAGILLLFSLGLITIGGLKTAQTASIILGFPLMAVLILVLISLWKMLRSYEREKWGTGL